MSAEREHWTITLRAEPGDTRPPIIRLRKLLKLALRVCRLRCVDLKASGGNEQNETKPGGDHAAIT